MKTKSILDKYRKLLKGLLECEESDIRFFVGKACLSQANVDGSNRYIPTLQKLIESGSISEIGEIKFEKKDEEYIQDWNVGNYSVICKDRLIASWKLYQLPHCCAYIVSCQARVEPDFRNKRIGTMMNNLRQDIGRLLGYSSMLCTDIQQNEHQRKLLATNGWKDIHQIKNRRTGNHVYLSVINL